MSNRDFKDLNKKLGRLNKNPNEKTLSAAERSAEAAERSAGAELDGVLRDFERQEGRAQQVFDALTGIDTGENSEEVDALVEEAMARAALTPSQDPTPHPLGPAPKLVTSADIDREVAEQLEREREEAQLADFDVDEDELRRELEDFLAEDQPKAAPKRVTPSASTVVAPPAPTPAAAPAPAPTAAAPAAATEKAPRPQASSPVASHSPAVEAAPAPTSKGFLGRLWQTITEGFSRVVNAIFKNNEKQTPGPSASIQPGKASPAQTGDASQAKTGATSDSTQIILQQAQDVVKGVKAIQELHDGLRERQSARSEAHEARLLALEARAAGGSLKPLPAAGPAAEPAAEDTASKESEETSSPRPG